MIEDIKEIVAGYYGLKPADLERRTKERYFSQPRQVAIWICREVTGAGWGTLASAFGLTSRSAQEAHDTIARGENEELKRTACLIRNVIISDLDRKRQKILQGRVH